MNFTLGDHYKNPKRNKACSIDLNIRKDMRKKFLKHIVPDQTDIWGQNISDRQFYTMPSTGIVNDQSGFANWLYGSMGKCKTEGKNCLEYRDDKFHRARIYKTIV